MSGIRRFHAAAWDEGIVYELGAPGRRGIVPPAAFHLASAAARSLTEKPM